MRLGTERMAYKKEDYHRQEKKLVETKKKGLAHHFWSDVKKRKRWPAREKKIQGWRHHP